MSIPYLENHYSGQQARDIINALVDASNNIYTGSYTGSFTGSLQGSASYALSASWAPGGGGTSIDTSSFATTGSNIFKGDQTIEGNLTFPSGSFISSTNISGNLYFSSLNGGILHLNDDGGEGGDDDVDG
jgi:hypothetical protein